MNKYYIVSILTIWFSSQLIAQNSQSVKDDPKGAWEFERMRTADPVTGEIPYEKFELARKQARQQILDQRANGIRDFGNWTERGPNNFGGRTRAIMWDPNDPDHKKVWAGGVDGGLWVNEDITDENSGWTRVFSEENGFAISTITYDPNNTEIFYFGTGELWPKRAGQSFGKQGGDIWYSEDGGINWNPFESGLGGYNIWFINKIKIDQYGIIYACTDKGLFSYDTNWTKILDGNISDIEISNDNTIFVARSAWLSLGSEIFKKTNDSNVFQPITNGNYALSLRVELTIKEDEPNVIYAIGIGYENETQGVDWFIKTVNGGNDWTNLSIPNNYELCIENPFVQFTNKQGIYNITLEVSDEDSDNIILGGIDLYKSMTGGLLWTRISSGDQLEICEQYMHADQHNIIFDPSNSNNAIIVNDGGVWYADNLFHPILWPTFSERNKNYNVTQFYTCFPHPNNDYVIGGTQDNGTITIESINSASGIEAASADGGFSFIDYNEPNYQICSKQHWYYLRSQNGGSTFSPILIPRKDKGSFINPTDYDQDLNILYTYYEPNVLRRLKGITSSISKDKVYLTNQHAEISKVLSIKSSNHSDGTIFIAAQAEDFITQEPSNRLFKLENANSEPIITMLNEIDNDFYSYINCITIGINENQILITVTSDGINSNIYESISGGDLWVDKQGNLDSIPVYWAEFNPNNYNQVLIATEVGLYKTDNITASNPVWDIIPIASGADPSLSLVRCDMIRVRPSDSKVYVATHGRGIWESNIFMDGTQHADLVVWDLNPLVNTAVLNQSFEVDVTIKNKGTADAPYNTSQCFISDDNELSDDDHIIFQYNMGNISPGQSLITNNWNITIPGSAGLGDKYLLFVADGLESVDEGSNESNNVLPIQIHISSPPSGGSGPDLTVLNEFVSKRVIQQGLSFSVNCDIMNQGDSNATGGWRQKWYLSEDQSYSLDDLQLDFHLWAFLLSDSTRYIHREMIMPTNVADGEYYILIYIDANQELDETVEWNNIRSLPITVGTIPIPELYSPMDDEEEVSFNPTFYWEDLGAGADSYDFAIYDYVTQNGNTYLQQVYYEGNITESEWEVNGFNFDYDEGYMWTARCRIDGTHGEWATVHSFRTKYYLSKPVLYDPNNYITNELLSPTFTWSNINNANYYKLTIALDEEMDDEVEDWSGLTENWFTIPSGLLDTAVIYYWNIKAYAGAGTSNYSQVFQFKTGGDIVPGTPENIIPVHDSAGVSLSPQLSWETGNGVPLTYQIDISSDSVFETLVFTQNNITTTNYFVPVGYLDGLSKYYWRVRAWNGAGFSQFSDSSAFITTSAGGPGSIKWSTEVGSVRGTPVFDYQGFMWCSINYNLVKLNPITGDSIITLTKFAWHEFNEGITISHDGQIIYTVVASSVFGDGDADHIAALDLNGNLLWHYDTFCRDVSKPVLDAAGNLYVTLSDGYPPYEDESSVISLDPQGNFRWRGLIFDDAEEFCTCPVVYGNLVIVGHDEIDFIGSVVALSTTNGSTVWQKNYPEEHMKSRIPGLSNIGISYSLTNSQLFYINYSNGENISGWPNTQSTEYWRATTVIDENGQLFNGTDHDLEHDINGYLYSFASNGSLIWQKDIDLRIERGQVIGDNGVLYFSSASNVLYAVNKETGEEIWTKNLNMSMDWMTIGPDGTLLITTQNPNGLVAIETSSTGLNSGHWPVMVHDYQGTNCYDHVDIAYTPYLADFVVKNNQDTTRTIPNQFTYNYLNRATHYKISEDSMFTGSNWIEKDSIYIFQISPNYETKTVYFVMKNENGNSDTLSDNIDYVSSAPIVTTDLFSKLNISNLELQGRVNSNILNTQYFMEYGTSTSYGNNSDTSSLIAGTEEINVNVYIDGLLPATQYHYRVVAVNAGGTTYGNDKTFTTHELFVPLDLEVGVLGYQTNLTWSSPELECYSCSILGYNVYRNSTLVNAQLLTNLNYADSSLVNGIYNYAVTAVYQEGESILSEASSIEIAGGGFPGGWNYIRTQNPHVIIIPIGSSPTIDATSLSKGDYLGVFYKRDGNDVCGGAARWNGTSTISIIAYGDDTLSLIKDGFNKNEKLTWKMKTWAMDSIMDATPTYDRSFANWDGKYYEFGLSGITEIENTVLQTLELNTGWNIASFFVSPQQFQLDTIIQSLINSNTLVKVIDESGGFIQEIPGIGWMNTIGDMANSEGYYIRVSANDIIITEGVNIDLPYDIPFQSGWNILGYPLRSSQDALTALQPIINNNHLIKVIDESGGFLQFIPDIGWVNTLGEFEPDEGYYIRLNSIDTLILNEVASKSSHDYNIIVEGKYFEGEIVGNPFLPMHVIANFVDGTPLLEGDELGIFINEICVGSTIITDPFSPVLSFISSDDPITLIKDGGLLGDLMVFKLMHLGIVFDLECKNTNTEELLFSPLETRVLTFSPIGLGTNDNTLDDFYVSDVIPNPVTKMAKVHLYIPQSGNLRIDIFNMHGVLIKNIINSNNYSKNMEIQVDVSNLAQGMYFLLIQFDNNQTLEKVVRKVVVKK